MFRKTPQKQTSFVSPKGKEKQIDYILTREDTWGMWKTLRPTTWSTWEVTIDVLWLLSWSTYLREKTMPGEKTKKHAEHDDEAKENNSEKSELEKRYQEIIVTIKKAATKKRKEAHDTRIDAKNTAAAAGAESTLVENAAQETEGKSKKRSSKDHSKSNTSSSIRSRKNNCWHCSAWVRRWKQEAQQQWWTTRYCSSIGSWERARRHGFAWD